MDLKFGKAPNERDENPSPPSEKKNQTSLLILLLILVVGFAYIYFFTDLIRPQEPVSAPVSAPKVVKKPLPSRKSDKVDVADETADAVSSKDATSGDKQQSVDVARSAKDGQQGKTGAVTVQPKAGTGKPGAKDDQHTKPVATQQKPVATTKAVPVPAPKAVVRSSGPWTVVAGYYQVEETLAADIVKMKNAGLNPLLTSGPKRPATVHRLIYAEYNSREQAKDAVQRLSNKGIDGFVSGSGSGFGVVVGSYSLLSGAQDEQKRLATAGVTVAIKKALVSLPTRKLSAGTYTDQTTAKNILNKLKAAGISTAVLE